MWKKLLTFALIANIVLTAGCVTAADKKAPSAEEADTYEMLNLFGEIMERTKASYVEEVSDQKLIESAINGMLSSLDPHSSFLDAKSFQYLNEQTQGKFGGLGIEVTMESGVVKVVSPIDDTPAFKAGLKPGDYIISLDGTTVVGMTLNEAVDKMRGKTGTKIKLTIRRGTEKPFDVTLKREEIKIQSVKSEIKAKDVAYIRISSFSEEVDKNVKDALAQMQKKTKNGIRGLVIDVRNNPGGDLGVIVRILDYLLPEGPIVRIIDASGEVVHTYTSDESEIQAPMVVLINENTASAAELFTSALLDYDKCVTVGQTTYGKGVMQNIITLPDGSGIRLTTHYYNPPYSDNYNGVGIPADYELEMASSAIADPALDTQLQKALSLLAGSEGSN